MKRIFIYLFFVIITAIGLSLIYPIKYHYLNTTIPSLPPYRLYDSAMKDLRDSILIKANQFKCRQYIIPVESIKGDKSWATLYPTLKEDINLALFSYHRWKLRANISEIDAMKKRYNKISKEWGRMMDFENIISDLKKQLNVEINTNYDAQAEIYKLPVNQGNDQKLIVKVNDIRKRNLVFQVEVHFVSPLTLKRLQEERERHIAYIHNIKNKADISIYGLKISGGLFLLYVLTIFTFYYYKKIKSRDEAQYLLAEIEKLQTFADNGHFVAALQLAEKYLKYFPNDSSVIAFKERLLDFTNNDPKKAQIAFVEAKKLQMRVNMAKENPMQAFLSDEEKERIMPYLEYYPELKKSYLALESGEKEANKLKEFQIELENLKRLISEGKLKEAESLSNKIRMYKIESPDLKEIMHEIKKKKEHALDAWKEIQNNLIAGDVEKVENKLTDIQGYFADMPEALSLQQAITASRGKTRFLLKPAEINEKIIKIYCGKEFILGRADEDITPDIIFNDKHVSRRHAFLVINENQIAVEDLNSTGGTYINGKKINKQNLKNGDVLTLAKMVDMGVTIFLSKEGDIGGVILTGVSTVHIIVASRISFDYQNNKFYTGSGKFQLSYNNDILLFSTHQKVFLLADSSEIYINNTKYTVGDINENMQS